jgi:hypothetical protein
VVDTVITLSVGERLSTADGRLDIVVLGWVVDAAIALSVGGRLSTVDIVAFIASSDDSSP